MRVAVGGTFHIIHDGHKKLLEEAFNTGDFVLIGLTSDEFANSTRDYRVRPYKERYQNLLNFVSKFGKDFEIRMINDHYGPTIEEDFDYIVVSYETKRYAEEINIRRKLLGKKEMVIKNIGRVLGEDLIPITSTRIVKGKINENGKRLTELVVNVGSENMVKLRAVEKAFKKFFNFPVKVQAKKVDTKIKQPYNEDTIRLAIKRAEESIENGDYGVGIESGLMWSHTLKRYFDVHYIVIQDSLGYKNYSTSMGFLYPENFMEELNNKTIDERFSELYHEYNVGRKKGAIGFLTNGKLTREKIIEDAVKLALHQKASFYYYL